jgi:putative membrane protein insertion efficiency factor
MSTVTHPTAPSTSETTAGPDGAVAPARRPWRVRAALFAITCYQSARSTPSGCRFYPSCSAYAAEAVERRGLARGVALTARRLVRCRPYGPHGIDLVPLAADRPEGAR